MGTFIAIVAAFAAGILARHFWPQEKALIIKGEREAVDRIKHKLGGP
jgi:hypothetical protein